MRFRYNVKTFLYNARQLNAIEIIKDPTENWNTWHCFLIRKKCFRLRALGDS